MLNVWLNMLLNFFLHYQAWLKDNNLFGRYRYNFTGARITACPAFSLFYLKNAEVSEFNLISLSQSRDDGI